MGLRNVSPERSLSLSEQCERELRAFFQAEYRIYEQAISEWSCGWTVELALEDQNPSDNS